MLYYGLLDPVTDLRVVNVEHRWIDLYIEVEGREVGSLRLRFHQLAPMLARFHGKHPVAERDESGIASWSADYSKRTVVSEDGTLERTEDLT
jgi:hypothetical protein